MKLKRLNKRGFSLVEVIIAMAVVSIVTFTALSIIYPVTDKTTEASAQSNAIYFAADVIECFKATGNIGDCLYAANARGGMIPVAERITLPSNIQSLYSNYSDLFRTEAGFCYVGVKFDTNNPNVLLVRAVDHNGNILIDETFTKAPR